jgi:malate dehydrogenase (oxaloacetate-decarboxylating)(NADP+)
MAIMNLKLESLEYHSIGRPGKIEIRPTKPCATQLDLSLAYSPGVAEPCLRIAADPQQAFRYTSRGNLVAVISNGTAVLGLGNLGALASKPVMEGKGILFKRFADIDVFDIELGTESVEDIIRVCQLLEPTFGGINLEDIKAPECFEIESRLKETMNIPVFHDDQHGTAIISAAAVINAMEIAGKPLDKIKVVFNGAGASALACAALYMRLGVTPENVLICDSKGVLYKGRKEGMNKYKEPFVRETSARTLADAMCGADVFVGLSQAGCVTREMVQSMAANPTIFAMANPDPEITPEEVKSARNDAIMATGRSDYPNQVNNVLGFPFIFRGALDVRATKINEEMKMAAVKALAALAKEPVPDYVLQAYGLEHLEFGPDYIIPTPFDQRLMSRVSVAVAKAAIETGVAREVVDLELYKAELESRLEHIMEMQPMADASVPEVAAD